MTVIEAQLDAWRARALRPVDAAGLAVFRMGFGVLMLIAVVRFFAHGWIAEYFLTPTHFFKYWGFSWVVPWPAPLMYLHFALMGACALGVALGYRYRASVIGFGILFCYAHLIDKTNYLNHYYLVVCLSGLMAILPLGSCWSLDARRRSGVVRDRVPAWMVWLLRGQFAVVYFYGGVAKLKSDWLLSAEPLSLWLGRHGDLPLLGGILVQPWTAHAMSWAGAVFDLSIVPLLLVRRTRPFAYVAVISFHLLTARLFPIGMFPYIMMFGSLLFLEPSWPRDLARRWGLRVSESSRTVPGIAVRYAPALGVFIAFQLLLPLRHWLYPGNVCWTEQGFRFAWNVMLMEKNGSVDFRVVDTENGRHYRVSPRRYFTSYQTKMMAPQPDMVLEAAHIIAEDFRARGIARPAVFADAFVSLNGRPMQRLIDPHVDLTRQVDGLSNKSWIVPMSPSQEGQAQLAWSSP